MEIGLIKSPKKIKTENSLHNKIISNTFATENMSKAIKQIGALNTAKFVRNLLIAQPYSYQPRPR